MFFFYRAREGESRLGNGNRYYGISETELFDREHVDYDRESDTQDGKIRVTTSNIKLEKIVTVIHKLYSNKSHIEAFKHRTG